MNKENLRNKYSNIRDNIHSDIRCNKSQLIFNTLFTTYEYNFARDIFLYYNFGTEISTSDFFDKMIEDNKRIYLPRCINGKMVFFQLDYENLEKSKFGIFEPKSSCIQKTSDEKTLIIVPGLCFSKDFFRIGYGGGYYDRYLKENKYFSSIGICFSQQIVEDIPHDDYDIPVDFIITDKEIIRR